MNGIYYLDTLVLAEVGCDEELVRQIVASAVWKTYGEAAQASCMN